MAAGRRRNPAQERIRADRPALRRGADGSRLLSPRLMKRFADFDVDGLRTDTAGHLYVAWVLKGTVAVLTPAGKRQTDAGVEMKAGEPTSLAFGGVQECRNVRIEPRFLPASRSGRLGGRIAPDRPKTHPIQIAGFSCRIVSSSRLRRNNSPEHETIFPLACRRPETLAH